MESSSSLDPVGTAGLALLFNELAAARSPRTLLRRREARQRLEEVDAALSRVEHIPAPGPPPGSAPFYRVASWNVCRGTAFDGVLRHIRHDPVLSRADVLLLTELDKGMARSDNRDVARELGRELGMNVAFVPCYLNLTKGNGAERSAAGENALGLHGNAILSRYPLAGLRVHPLPNGRDKLSGPERRIGRQRGLTAEVALPGLPIAVTCLHLDAHASRAHRCRQMQQVLAETASLRGPHLIGGDWNTTTFDCQSGTAAVADFASRLPQGLERSLRDDQLHPERRLERPLFEALRRAGFEWDSCNVAGVPTWHFDLGDGDGALRDWLPRWAPRVLEWALRRSGGRSVFKIDWLAARGLACSTPQVLAGLRHAGARVSDHDPIVVDLLPPSPKTRDARRERAMAQRP
jgi:endonuclease/exonuclease/phosphatase family metal-dependent hydrolase